MFSDDLAEDDVFVTLAQKVAHNVLWTLTDTLRTADASLSAGTTYDMTWVWYTVFPAELVFAAGIAVLVFFAVRNIRRANRDGAVVEESEVKTE